MRRLTWKATPLLLTATLIAGCGGGGSDDGGDDDGTDGADASSDDGGSEDGGIALPDSPRCDETIGVTDDSIEVTVITDLSGPIAQLGGIDHATAFESRFERINAEGGIDGYEIVVNTVDGRYDPVEIANQYEQARSTSALIGDVLGSNGMDAIGQDVADDCMIAFMGSPNGELSQKYATTFSPSTTYGHELLNTIEWVIDEEGEDLRWAVAYQGDALGDAVLEAAEHFAEETGTELVAQVTFGPTDEDMTPQAQSLLEADVDYVIYGGLPGQLAGLSATVFAQGSEMKFITQTGGWTPGLLQTPAREAIESNVLISTSYGGWDEDLPGLEQMREDIGDASTPGQGSLTGYATAMVVEQVLRTAIDADDLTLGGFYRAAMQTSFDPEGVMPPLEFGQFPDEPRIPSHQSRVLQPDGEALGGVSPLTEYFESELSAAYVEPEL